MNKSVKQLARAFKTGAKLTLGPSKVRVVDGAQVQFWHHNCCIAYRTGGTLRIYGGGAFLNEALRHRLNAILPPHKQVLRKSKSCYTWQDGTPFNPHIEYDFNLGEE